MDLKNIIDTPEKCIELFGRDYTTCALPNKVAIKSDGIKVNGITSQYAKQGYNKWNYENGKKHYSALQEEFYFCIPCEKTMNSKTHYNLHMKKTHQGSHFFDKNTGQQLNKY